MSDGGSWITKSSKGLEMSVLAPQLLQLEGTIRKVSFHRNHTRHQSVHSQFLMSIQLTRFSWPLLKSSHGSFKNDPSYIILFIFLQPFKGPMTVLMLYIWKLKFSKILNLTNCLITIYLTFNRYLLNTYHVPGLLEINSKQERIHP